MGFRVRVSAVARAMDDEQPGCIRIELVRIVLQLILFIGFQYPTNITVTQL